MSNLVELFDNIVQMQNLNGVPLANGKMYVYALGRTRLMDTWSDVDGESLNSNPVILDAAGQCHCYVSDDFDYTLVVTDAYDNEIFSIDKYLYSQGSHSHADVAVAPSETIAVSSYHVGETTVYVPYLTGQLGKVYEGIDPIVVNNVEDKISANHVPLGVQEPLYFVQDDEEGCIIGISGGTVPEGTMNESALGFENNKITGYNGSAFSAGNEYEAGSYIDITDNTISVTGLQPAGDYAYNSALSSKLDVTATGQFLTGLPDDLMHSGDMTAYQPVGDYQTAGDYLSASDSGKFYPMEGNPSGFLTAHQSLQGYATEQWVENKGYITGVDIPESADWNEATTVVNNNSAIWNTTTNIVSANSAQWAEGSTANPQIPVTGINGIKISESGDKVVFEVSGTFLTAIPNTYLQNTDLTITDGKISEISGVPLSGGGTVDMSAYVPYSATEIAFTGNTAVADSLAYGSNNLANNDSFAGGIRNSATNFSIAHGTYNNANGNSLAVGQNNSANNNSLAIGFHASANTRSLSLGYYPSADNFSLSLGYQTKADYNSLALGNYSEATNNSIALNGGKASSDSFSLGGTASTGSITVGNYANKADKYSQALGFRVSATNSGMAIGCLNATTTAAFVIGNGSADKSTYPTTYTNSDAFIIFHDGSVSAAGKISANGVELGGGGGELPESVSAATDYVTANSANIDSTINNVSANSGAWGGSALPISAGKGIKFELVDNTLVASVTSTNTGYIWQSASLFHTDTPTTQTNYTLSDNCSNYDRLDVDFYDINDWRTVMECPIPSNLDASGTRGGYFSVVTQSTATNANIWFKAFNWTAAGTTWTCYCSELAGQGGSTNQTINANQPNNPPKVVNIIGWKRVRGN